MDLTPKLSWRKFLKRVKQELEISTEEVKKAMAGATWGIGKRGSLPLRDTRGYMTMLQQVASKDANKTMVFVSLPPSFSASKKGQSGNKENNVAELDERHHTDTMYEKKVSSSSSPRTYKAHSHTAAPDRSRPFARAHH